MQLIQKYFPGLTSFQKEQFSCLEKSYREWNEKINVVSRKDIDHLYERHVLHSLAVAKFISFKKNTRVLDVGTGGGFPGIPLAIFFPEIKFHLVDSIGKKIKVVNAITGELKLKNISAEQKRAGELKGNYNFILSRAVAPIKTIYEWTARLISSENKNQIPDGWILLKGGDLKKEIKELKKPVKEIRISDYFEELFFQEKFIIHFTK